MPATAPAQAKPNQPLASATSQPPKAGGLVQQTAIALKKVIESVYTDGITAILKTDMGEDGNITGKFADGPQVYNFTLTANDKLQYNEAEATGERSDAYLLGYTVDSGMALRGQRLDAPSQPPGQTSTRSPKCEQGKRCGGSCVAKGLMCSVALSGEAKQVAQQVRSAIGQIKGNSAPTNGDASKTGNAPKALTTADIKKFYNFSVDEYGQEEKRTQHKPADNKHLSERPEGYYSKQWTVDAEADAVSEAINVLNDDGLLKMDSRLSDHPKEVAKFINEWRAGATEDQAQVQSAIAQTKSSQPSPGKGNLKSKLTAAGVPLAAALAIAAALTTQQHLNAAPAQGEQPQQAQPTQQIKPQSPAQPKASPEAKTAPKSEVKPEAKPAQSSTEKKSASLSDEDKAKVAATQERLKKRREAKQQAQQPSSQTKPEVSSEAKPAPKSEGKPEAKPAQSSTEKKPASKASNDDPDGLTHIGILGERSKKPEAERRGELLEKVKAYRKEGEPERSKMLASIYSYGENLVENHDVPGVPNAPPPYAEQLGALQNYTTSSFRQINNVLRGNDRGPGVFQDDELVMLADLADQGLSHLPRHQGSVYRGGHIDHAILSQYEVGKTITEKGFSSTSQIPTVAENFSKEGVDDESKTRAVFIINSKNGRSVEGFSLYPEEKEILMRPSTAYKVLDKRVNPQTGLTEIYLDEVSHEK